MLLEYWSSFGEGAFQSEMEQRAVLYGCLIRNHLIRILHVGGRDLWRAYSISRGDPRNFSISNFIKLQIIKYSEDGSIHL